MTKHGRRAAAAASAERAQVIEERIDGEEVGKVLAALAEGTEKHVPFRRRTTRSRTD